ncbi:unnamed protein product [Ambrosiozyma monospora]|uniref:Unnamed protein product n=1 Tax=Ambrosiozyma monospora TaxID=43982 RepID=A0ACB5T866_AMBMO|nr:unnamed protein product [Ambrosiozyma monospora]
MLSLCILTNEYPVVRYYNSAVSMKLAIEFQKKLDEYYRKNPDLSPVNNKTVFLVTDRSMDMFGPFCHTKYYRSGIFDLMGPEDGMIGVERGSYDYIWKYEARTGQGMETKYLMFDSKDAVYNELKDTTFEEFTKRIVELLNELKVEDDKFNNLKYVSDIAHATLTQNEHLEKKQLITGHFKLIEQISSKFKNENLLDLIVFENKCASNLGPNKEQHEPITEELIELLANETIDMTNKIRLLIVYTYYRGGITESDLTKLLKFSMPEKVESICILFKNFDKLGAKLIKPDLTSKPFHRKTYFGVNDTEELTERYIPSMTNLVTRLANNKLPEAYNTQITGKAFYSADEVDEHSEMDFPYVKGVSIEDLEMSMNDSSSSLPSQVRNQPRWKNAKQQTKELTRQKLLLFCAGGLTNVEVATILSQQAKVNRTIFVGTDEVYSPLDLIGDIRLIDDERMNLNLTLDKKLDRKKQVPKHLFDKSAPPPPRQQQRRPQQQQQQQQQRPQQQVSQQKPALRVQQSNPSLQRPSTPSSTSSSETAKSSSSGHHRFRKKFW